MPSHALTRRRSLPIVAGVLLLHGLALWGLQSGLLQRTATPAQERVVPVSLLSEVPVAARPAPMPAPAAAPAVPATALARPAAAALAPPVAPSPLSPQPPATPQATADSTAAANAASGAHPVPGALALPATASATGATGATPAVATAATPAAATAAAAASKGESPTLEAEYLVKPNRKYPPHCERRREQGTVLVRVLIGVDGNAVSAEVSSSSASDCLNREALDTALAAKYKPVVRAGVAMQAWRDASYRYVLPE